MNMINFNKHFEQIKIGGIHVVVKKVISFIYLMLRMPVYILLIPIIIIIRLIKPWFLIRWQQINSGRIGHFAINTELYCCERDAGINSPSQRHVDLFYLKKYVCNKQLKKMWLRSGLIILPEWLLHPLFQINRFINIFVPGGNYHNIGYLSEHMNNSLTSAHDINDLLCQFQTHIYFTDEEKLKGKRILNNFGLPEGAKFVCLIVRDSAYLDRHKKSENYPTRSWKYHNYRDGDVDKYVLAAEELAKRGYYVFRLGAKVLKPLKSSNPKVIDYASGMRSDFMDIYLAANCSFCLTNGMGIDEVSRIFRKPIASVIVPLAYQLFFGGNEKELLITKSHIHKKNKNNLTISEIFSSNLALNLYSENFERSDVKLKENSPEEIRDLVIEMDERLNGNWNETEEDILLQKKFWLIFKKNIKNLNLEKPLHGKIKSKFGAKFLRENQNWIR